MALVRFGIFQRGVSSILRGELDIATANTLHWGMPKSQPVVADYNVLMNSLLPRDAAMLAWSWES